MVYTHLVSRLDLNQMQHVMK